MASLQDKFRGCLLGAAVGDVAGAVVEAESAQFIGKTYRSIDEILATKTVEELTGPAWQVGRYTDDTQMLLCVAEWLIDDPSHSPELLLAKFAEAYEPWRRYGPGTAGILRVYPQHKTEWRQLSTAMFPEGSLGNGSAMRVAPIGLAYSNNISRAAAIALESSRPTHSHSLAYQGAVLQSVAVATAAAASEFSAEQYLGRLRGCLARFTDLMQDTSMFGGALEAIEQGLKNGTPCAEMASKLGTGITAHEAVPMALYCFLRHPDSYSQVIHEAVFAGGDTDTIASMAGAISGALLGNGAIPSAWLDRVHEDKYSVGAIEGLADRLCEKYSVVGNPVE